MDAIGSIQSSRGLIVDFTVMEPTAVKKKAPKAHTSSKAPAATASVSASASTKHRERVSTELPERMRLWVNVIEGLGFPENVKESHIAVILGQNRLVGKKTQHDASHPKWGERFILDWNHECKELSIEVKATEAHHLHSVPLMQIDIPIEDINSKVDIYQWFKSQLGDATILIHVRKMPISEATAEILHKRMPTLGFELPHHHKYTAGDTIRGAIVFSANRPRQFSDAIFAAQHATNTGETAITIHFEVELFLPHNFPNAPLETYKMPAGLYYWPFSLKLPNKMDDCQRAPGATTQLELSITFAKAKSKIIYLDVHAREEEKDNNEKEEEKEGDNNVELKILSSGPLIVMDPKEFVPRTDLTGVEADECIPSASICKGLRSALFH